MLKNKKSIQATEEDSEDQTEGLIPRSIIYEDPELTTRIEYEDPKQTKLQKFTNKFRKGSMINSIALLFSFSPNLLFILMPFAIMNTGYILFILILSFCAFTSGYITFLLLKIKDEKQVSSFHQLLSQLIGRMSCLFYHSMHIIYLLGMTLMYLLLSKGFLFLISNVGGSAWSNVIFHLGGLLCFQMPSTFVRAINKLRIVEFALMLAALITGVICSIDSVVHIISGGDLSHLQNYFAPFNYGYGLAIAILTIAFSNQLYFYPELKQLKMFTLKRGTFLIQRTVLLQIIWYLALGVLCFLNFTNKNSPLILFEHTLSLKERSSLMTYLYHVLLFLLIFLVQFKIANGAVRVIEEAVEAGALSQSSKGYAYNVYPIAILFLMNALIFFVKSKLQIQKVLIGVIGVQGGIISSVLCLILPIYSYNQLFYDFISTKQRFFHISLIITSLALGIGTTVLSFLLIIKK